VTIGPQGELADGHTCSVTERVTDTYAGTATSKSTAISILETNTAPTITNLPASKSGNVLVLNGFTVTGAEMDITAGLAQTISWSVNSHNCTGFAPTINPTTGRVSWTCGSAVQTCTANIRATDNYIFRAWDQKALTINCLQVGGSPPMLSYVFPSRNPLDGGTPPVLSYVFPLRNPIDNRARLNAHINQKLTAVFSSIDTRAPDSVTAQCVGPTTVNFICDVEPGGISTIEPDWICTPTSAFNERSTYTCTVSGANGGGVSNIVTGAMTTAVINVLAGMSQGYIGSLTYDSDEGGLAPSAVILTAVSAEEAGPILGKVYVQVIQGTATREFFTNPLNGSVAMYLPPVPIDEITLGYKCGLQRCESLLHPPNQKVNPVKSAYYSDYQFKTWTNVDASRLVLPLPLMDGAWFGRNKAIISGTISTTAFANYVGPRQGADSVRVGALLRPPVRLRAGVIIMTFKDTSAIAGGLDALLLTPDYMTSLAICMDTASNIKTGLAASVPVNFLVPELIRKNWTTPCSAFTTNESQTSYQVWSWTPGEWRVVWTLGAYVNASNFSLSGNLDLFGLPIYVSAVGMQGIGINPALRTAPYNYSINLQADLSRDYREMWTNDTSVGTALGYDPDPSVDRKVLLEIDPGALPIDPARLNARTTLVYRHPNLTDSELNTKFGIDDQDLHFYRKGILIASGADFGPQIGMGITGLALNPKIDDAEFTMFQVGYFQSVTGQRMGYRDLRPWNTATADSEIVSIQHAGSSSLWPDVVWTDAWGTHTLDYSATDTGGPVNYAAIIALSRGGFVENCTSDLSTDPSTSVSISTYFNPGSLVSVWHIGDPIATGNEVVAAVDFLNLPAAISPVPNEYVYPAPQWSNTVNASNPVNRNGEMWPDRTVDTLTGKNSLQKEMYKGFERYYVEFTRTGMYRNTAKSAPDLWTTSLAESGIKTLDGATIIGFTGKRSAKSRIGTLKGMGVGTTGGVFRDVIDVIGQVTAPKVPYRLQRFTQVGINPGDSVKIKSFKARCETRLYVLSVVNDTDLILSVDGVTPVTWTSVGGAETRDPRTLAAKTCNLSNANHLRYYVIRRDWRGECKIDDWNAGADRGGCKDSTFWGAEGAGVGSGNIRVHVPKVVSTPGLYTATDGSTGIVPDLWDGLESFHGTQLSWSYSVVIYNSGAVTAGGMGRKFNFNNRDMIFEDPKQIQTSSDSKWVYYQ